MEIKKANEKNQELKTKYEEQLKNYTPPINQEEDKDFIEALRERLGKNVV